MKNILGTKIVILGNDFTVKDSFATIVAVDLGNKKLLLKLDNAVVDKKLVYPYAVASPRIISDNIDVLFKQKQLACTLTWVPQKKYNDKTPFELSWWRGGAATITDLCLK